MAKKVVATLKSKEKGPQIAKVIRAVKNDKGFYSFKEDLIRADKVQDFINEKK